MAIRDKDFFLARRLGVVSIVEKTVDAEVKTTSGTLYGFRIQFSGVTVGDKVEIQNGSTVIFTIIAVTTDEVHKFTLPNGMAFSMNIYHNETKTGGMIYATYAYD